MFLPETPYVFGRNTVYLYHKHRIFLFETSYVFRKNTVCFYGKLGMFLSEISHVFVWNIVCFYDVAAFFNIGSSFLLRANFNVFCRVNLKDFCFSRKTISGKNKRFSEIIFYKPAKRIS